MSTSVHKDIHEIQRTDDWQPRPELLRAMQEIATKRLALERKIQRALENEPDRPGAGHRLVDLYRTKLSLLERTVRLAPGPESSGRREEST